MYTEDTRERERERERERVCGSLCSRRKVSIPLQIATCSRRGPNARVKVGKSQRDIFAPLCICLYLACEGAVYPWRGPIHGNTSGPGIYSRSNAFEASDTLLPCLYFEGGNPPRWPWGDGRGNGSRLRDKR